ncbi:MAG: histidine kinase [Tannerellaceae bacterium]|nr:histidine kinase [Tannerellaceae bacterium]
MTNPEEKQAILYYLSDKKYHVHRHVLVQLFALIYAADIFCAVPGQLHFSTDLLIGFLGMYLILNMTIYPNAYVLVPRYLEKGKRLKYILSVIVLIVLCVLIMLVIYSIVEKTRLDFLLSQPGNMWLMLLTSALTFALQIVAVSAFFSFKKWLEDNQRAEELKAATLATELMFLKSQINPHFLFNMLNNANILIDENPRMSSQILIKLDDLLRYQMTDSTRDQVDLSADIGFLRDFLDLEKTRRDEFEYMISERGDINHVQVAPLLFIPFVENAIKHNHNDGGVSYVHLSFAVRNNNLEFICENSISQDQAEKR